MAKLSPGITVVTETGGRITASIKPGCSLRPHQRKALAEARRAIVRFFGGDLRAYDRDVAKREGKEPPDESP